MNPAAREAIARALAQILAAREPGTRWAPCQTVPDPQFVAVNSGRRSTEA